MSRVVLTELSSRAWEHPADKAALASLRKVPGFDVVVRKIFGLIAEKPLMAITAGSAVEVGPRQYPRIQQLYDEVLETLDAPSRPALYVSQSPVVNAGAVGIDEPFIVLSSGSVAILSDAQLRYVLGHEIGHIGSGHVLYKTMLRVMLRLGTWMLGTPITGAALLAVLAALLEWDRKSELSADRAGLLAVQDPDVVRAGLLRIAGGVAEGANIEAFREQARRYEEEGSAIDSLVRTLALLGQSHPFPVLRLREIDRWVEGGGYGRVLEGDYPRRADDPAAPTWEDWKESANAYADGVKASADPVASWLKSATADVSGKASSVWSRVRRKNEGPHTPPPDDEPPGYTVGPDGIIDLDP